MKLHHTLFLWLIIVIWGFNFVAAKFVVQSFSPFAANAIRFGIVFLCFSPFFKVIPGYFWQLLGMGLLLGVAHFSFLFIGLATGVDVGSMSIVTQLNVPFSAMLAVFLLGEKVGWRRWLAIAVSFTGIAIISFDPKVFRYLDATLWIAASALVYGMATVAMRALKQIPAMTLQSWVALTGCLGSLFISLLVEENHADMVMTALPSAWLGVAYAAVFSSVLGHGGVNYLLRQYDVAMITPTFLLMPAFAILGSFLFFGEVFTLRMAVGGLLTMIGVTVITFRNQSRPVAVQDGIAPIEIEEAEIDDAAQQKHS